MVVALSHAEAIDLLLRLSSSLRLPSRHLSRVELGQKPSLLRQIRTVLPLLLSLRCRLLGLQSRAS